MYELKKLREVTQSYIRKGDSKVSTRTKWKAIFKDEDDDENVSLNLSIEYDSKPTELVIGSRYKVELKE